MHYTHPRSRWSSSLPAKRSCVGGSSGSILVLCFLRWAISVLTETTSSSKDIFVMLESIYSASKSCGSEQINFDVFFSSVRSWSKDSIGSIAEKKSKTKATHERDSSYVIMLRRLWIFVMACWLELVKTHLSSSQSASRAPKFGGFFRRRRQWL